MDCCILIVDDNEAICTMLRDILEDEGYQVVCVECGREALAHLETTDALPDVILLDLLMPEMSGADFRRAQQRQPRLATIPVVVMSVSRTLTVSSIDPPATVAIAKPFSFDALVAVIEQVCGEERTA